MNQVQRMLQDGIAVLSLDSGVTNPINGELVAALNAALDDLEQEASFRGLVLTSESSKFFSIGFDLPSLYPLDRPAILNFYHSFNDLALRLFTLGVPTLCAMPGHATAGGCILALMCDYRFMAEGRKLIGLNEIKLGLAIPHLADQAMRLILPERQATELLYGGEFVDGAEALRIGLVDRLTQPERLREEALAKISSLAPHSGKAFGVIKDNRIHEVRERYERSKSLEERIFIDLWFDPPAREKLAEALKRF